MSTIDELRGLVARASKGDTISIFQLRHRLEENAPALLAVAEAAREALSLQSIGKVDGEEFFRPHMMPETERSLRSLRSALARLDGEVGP